MNNFSATAEDVFYLYERNKSHYDNCNLAKRCCPSEESNMDCYCQIAYESVLPITIGDQTVPCNFKRKVYVKPGEECSICLEPVMTKQTAYLTPCGHSFHKICMFNALAAVAKNNRNFKCPNCRANIGYPDIYCRYTAGFKARDGGIYAAKHFLDTLEEFWLAKEFTMIQMCETNYKHSLGLDSNCRCCLRYRVSGM